MGSTQFFVCQVDKYHDTESETKFSSSVVILWTLLSKFTAHQIQQTVFVAVLQNVKLTLPMQLHFVPYWSEWRTVNTLHRCK